MLCVCVCVKACVSGLVCVGVHVFACMFVCVCAFVTLHALECATNNDLALPTPNAQLRQLCYCTAITSSKINFQMVFTFPP